LPVSTNTAQAGAGTKRETKTILLTDPAREEEAALDGRITFSVNAHKYDASLLVSFVFFCQPGPRDFPYTAQYGSSSSVYWLFFRLLLLRYCVLMQTWLFTGSRCDPLVHILLLFFSLQ
jgi:hypothetical protein